MAEPVLEPVGVIPEPGEIEPAERPTSSALTVIVASVVIVAALYFASEVLIPITLAVLLSFVLSPLMELMRRVWIPRVLAALLSVLVAIGIIIALGGVIGTQIAGLVAEAPQYQYTIEKKINSVQHLIADQLASRISFITKRLQNMGNVAPQEQLGKEPAANNDQPAQPPVPVTITESPANSALQLGERVVAPIFHPIATLGIILVVAIFTLLQKQDLRDRLIRLFGANDLHRATVAMDDAGRRLSRYFLTQLCVNCSFGVIIGFGLFVIGVPSPVLWGILGALLRFVPYIGVYLAVALPVLLAAAVGTGWSMAVWTAILFIVSDTIIGQGVEPMVYGHSTGLSPFSVIVAAIFWAWIWGPIGLILSTPLTVCLVVMGRHVERLEFLEVLLGDRPALTPVESFYQRLLAGDPSEAEEHAERFLKEHSLTAYYDDVAMPGLRLAVADARRGAFPITRLAKMRDAVIALIEDLADHADMEPGEHSSGSGLRLLHGIAREASAPVVVDPLWRDGSSVLCISGRGVLDEAAATMLVQLLAKHGIGARLISFRMASPAFIQTLDVGGVAVVCVIGVEFTGSPVHLRTLLRRLRARLPQTRILAGLWTSDDAVLRDHGARSQLGADMVVTGLREAEEACLAVARLGAPGLAPPAVASQIA